mmetsp:Transcript_9/g.16  ORF Transcript_9/g.16 Transcript_9/m.16 type:complete len:1189 (+) Transcript_9:114-3680(+)|eukprot:CAMPEP_0117431068 /NCGR_PEP_ID=MMETSP0758-20121206/10618_1 /TAXON_ID=63605 /ORGANISM="Percolomonas cosmopolitus, Strain AE-1 (ATCC 50343)" /LENGTH=1188 /DNA_ID=CAMNT_0005219739 /DNA_START=40 /DNA_END=3606 /DNA_ORIENTATION=-
MTTKITAPWKEYMVQDGNAKEALLTDWEMHLENLTTGIKKDKLIKQQFNELSVHNIERHIQKQVQVHGDFSTQPAWKKLIAQLCYLLKFEQRSIVASILDVIVRTFQLNMDTLDSIAIPILFDSNFQESSKRNTPDYFRQQQDELGKLTYLGVVINTAIVKGEQQIIDIANTLSIYFDTKYTKGHLTIFQTLALQLYCDLIEQVHANFDSHFMIKKVLQPTLNSYLSGIHINDANYITCYLAVRIHPIYADYILTQVRDFPSEAPMLHAKLFKMFMMKGFETHNIHPMLYLAMEQYKTQCEKIKNKKARYDHMNKKETTELVESFTELFRSEFFSKHNSMDSERTQFIGASLIEYLIQKMMKEEKPSFEGLTRLMAVVIEPLMLNQETFWDIVAKLHIKYPIEVMELFKDQQEFIMEQFLDHYLKRFMGTQEGFDAIVKSKEPKWFEQFLSLHVHDKPVFTLDYLKKIFDFAFFDQSSIHPEFYKANDKMSDEEKIEVDAASVLISTSQTAFFNALSHLFLNNKIAKIEKLLQYARENEKRDTWVGFDDEAMESRNTLLELYDNAENKTPHLTGARRLILCILFYQLQLPSLLNVESLDDLVITVQGFNVAANGIDDITPEQLKYGTETLIDISLELCSIDASMKGGIAAALAPLFKDQCRKKSLELLFNVVIQAFVEESHVTEVEGMHELVQDEMDHVENGMEDDEEEDGEEDSSSEDDIDEEALDLLAQDDMKDDDNKNEEEEEEEGEDALEWEGQDEFMFANDHLIASMFKQKKAQLDAERIVADEISTYRSNFAISILDVLRHLVKETHNTDLVVSIFIFLTRRYVKNTTNFTLSPIQAKVHKSIHQFIEFVVENIVLDFGNEAENAPKALHVVKGTLSPKTISSVVREVRTVIENMVDTKGMLPKCLQFLSTVFLEHPDEDGEIEKHTHSLFAKKIFHGSFTSSKAQRILHVLPWLLPKLSSSSLSQLEQLLKPVSSEGKLSNTSFKRISQLLAFIAQLFNHPNMRANEPEKVARMVSLLGILESSLFIMLNSEYIIAQCLNDKHLHMNFVHALQQYVPLAKRHGLLTDKFSTALERYNTQLTSSDAKLVAIRSRLNNILRLANIDTPVNEKKPKTKKKAKKRKRNQEPEKSKHEPPSKLKRQNRHEDVAVSKKKLKKEKKLKKKMKHANKRKEAEKRKKLSF